jgi:hypothetical protein
MRVCLRGRCYFCGADVDELGGPVLPRQGVVHHVNQNRRDSTPENLVAAHRDCHGRFHAAIPGGPPIPFDAPDFVTVEKEGDDFILTAWLFDGVKHPIMRAAKRDRAEGWAESIRAALSTWDGWQ